MQKALCLIIALITITPISGADTTSTNSKHKTTPPTNHLAGIFILLETHVLREKELTSEVIGKIQGTIDVLERLPLSAKEAETLSCLKKRLKCCSLRSKRTWPQNFPTAQTARPSPTQFPPLGGEQPVKVSLSSPEGFKDKNRKKSQTLKLRRESYILVDSSSQEEEEDWVSLDAIEAPAKEK